MEKRLEMAHSLEVSMDDIAGVQIVEALCDVTQLAIGVNAG